MSIYLCIALGAAALAYIGQRFHESLFVVGVLFMLASALLYCYFAGVRSVNVGTDTAGYGLGSYYAAKGQSFDYFYSFSIYKEWGSLFKVLCWGSTTLGGSFFWYLFAIQAATVIPLYAALYKGARDHLAFGVFFYGVVFYPMSFNMMRQMIAMSFLLLAFIGANDRKPLSFAIWLIVAVLFHKSALVGICIYPLTVYCSAKGKMFGRDVRVALTLLVCTCALALAPKILSIADTIGFYSDYISGSAVTSAGSWRPIVLTAAVFGLLLGIGLILRSRRQMKVRVSLSGILICIVFGIICLPLSRISNWLYRIGFYYIYLAVLALPNTLYVIEQRNARLLFIFMAAVSLLIWSYDYYCISLSHEVIPYVMSISNL